MDQLLLLPEPKIKEVKLKRQAGVPDLETFTPDQKNVFEELIDFYEGGNLMHLLEGYAGTGKTYITSRYLEYALSQGALNIAVTAPTNKAVKVLRKAVDFQSSKLAFYTTHSLLGLKEKIDAYGKIKFEADRTQPNKIDSYDFVIVDEVSMLDDALFQQLYFHTQRGCKLLFVGDSKQIPPVGLHSSIPFDAKKRIQYKIGRSVLSQIVRQKAGNPIIELTMSVRERPNFRECFGQELAVTDITEENTGVVVLNSNNEEHEKYLEQVMNTYYNSENFKQDADFMKMIAWTNNAVNYLNEEIRTMLYGETKGKLEIGEKLIANSPIMDGIEGKLIVFSTNDEFEVTGFEIKNAEIDRFSYKYYEAEVKYISSETGKHYTQKIYILHEDSKEGFDQHVQNLKELAVKAPYGSYEAGIKWKAYYSYIRLFADVKYGYAITAHKSQGSTYNNCIVFEKDINSNSNIVERNKIKYTAFSRASGLLIIVC